MTTGGGKKLALKMVSSLNYRASLWKDVCINPVIVVFTKSIDLSFNTSLRTLHLHSIKHPFHFAIISQIASHSIHQVILTLETNELCRLSQSHYLDLDSRLSDGSLQRLSSVRLMVPKQTPAIEHDTRQQIQVVFPQLYSRSLLHIFESSPAMVCVSSRSTPHNTQSVALCYSVAPFDIPFLTGTIQLCSPRWPEASSNSTLQQ